jgi:hypothetical protein
MSHFSTPETYGYLATITYLDELCQFSQLDLVITFLGTRSKLDFLNVHLALFLALVVQLFLLLKSVLTIIHQTTDWRFSIGDQFNQVQFGLFRELLRLFQCYDAFLLTVFGNKPDLRCRNIIVQTALFVICD